MPWESPICLPPPPSCVYDEDSSHLSAKLIFNEKDMKQYLRWQRDEKNIHHARAGLGRLPTAQQYGEFQRWCKHRKPRHDKDDFRGRAFAGVWSMSSDLGHHLTASESNDESSRVREDSAFSDGNVGKRDRQDNPIRTATMCKHVLHPANANGAVDELEFCPCCTVTHYVRYISLLTDAVNETAESKSPEEIPIKCDRQADRNGDHLDALYAWHAGKVEVLRTIRLLEDEADNETLWTAQNPDFEYDITMSEDCTGAEDASKTIMSAGRAISMYWESVETSVAPTDFAADAARQAVKAAAQTTGSKHVTFAASTDFERQSRPQLYFKRGSPRYTPGRWAFEVDSVKDEAQPEVDEHGIEQSYAKDEAEPDADEHGIQQNYAKDEAEPEVDEHDIEQSFFIDNNVNDYDIEQAEIPDDETSMFGDSEWALIIKAFNLQLSHPNESSETVTETPQSSMRSSTEDVSRLSDMSIDIDVEAAEVDTTEASKCEAGDVIPAANSPVERSVPADLAPNHDAFDNDAFKTKEEGEGSDFDEYEVEDELEDDDDSSDWETEGSDLDEDDDIDGEGEFIVFGY